MKNKISVNTVKNYNRFLILSELINNEQLTRTEIARKLELSNATVGTIADEFIEASIIKEEKILTNTIGRKPSYLKLNTADKFLLTIDLVSYEMSFALSNLTLSLKYTYKYKYDKNIDYKENLDRFLKETKSYLISENLYEKIIGISIAIPGTYNKDKDKVLCKVLPPLSNVKLKNLIEKYFTQDIFIENDIKLISTAELQKIKDFNSKSIFFMYLGEGIGGAFLINGSLYRGKNNFAGEIGQTMLSPTLTTEQSISWQKFISNVYEKHSKINNDNIQSFILNMYNDNNKFIKEPLDKILTDMVQALTNIIWLLNPDTIVINEKNDIIDGAFIDIITDMLKPNILPEILDGLEIISFPENEESLILGAAHVARDAWIRNVTQTKV